MKLKIELPLIETQGVILNSVKEAFISEKQKEVELLKKIIGLESEMQNQNNFLRHSIAGNLANLRGSFKRVKSIFENQIKISSPQLMILKENEASDLTLGKLLEMMERDIEKISNDTQRNSLGDGSLNKAIMEQIEIIPFLREYVYEIKNRSNRNFEITFDFIEEEFKDAEGNLLKVFINGNKDLLRDMLNNLIENAEIHAFESPYREKNLIEILLGSSDEKPLLTIWVTNNGKWLPEDFTYEMFVRKGSKAGENAGEGYGGWYIDQIIKKHEGELHIENESGTDNVGGTWATSFEISLPIISFENNEAV